MASPELALVCPELRREWIAALPDLDPERLFRPVRTPRPATAPAPPAEREVPLSLAAAAYTAVCVVQWLAWSSVALTLVTAVVLVLTLAG